VQAQWIADAALVTIAVRAVPGLPRPLARARPRRGDVDLGDRDPSVPAREREDESVARLGAAGMSRRWVVPASVTAAMLAAATARVAVVLI
jgi:hypothetical protein